MDGGAPALPPNDSKADGSAMPLSQKATATPTSKAKALGNKEGQKPGAHRVPAPVCLDNPNLVIDGSTPRLALAPASSRLERGPPACVEKAGGETPPRQPAGGRRYFERRYFEDGTRRSYGETGCDS